MFALALVVLPVVEVLVFVEVGIAVGWPAATVLLLGVSLAGVPLLRIQGRSALRGISVAVSQRRAPGRAALDAALGFLGCVLLVIPGFVTDAVGVLLLLPATRTLVRRWVSHRYARAVMHAAATAGRFTSRDRGRRPADVESTAIDVDRDQLGG